MHFGKKNPHYTCSMNGQDLECVKEERDLDVLFTDDVKVAGQCK